MAPHACYPRTRPRSRGLCSLRRAHGLALKTQGQTHSHAQRCPGRMPPEAKVGRVERGWRCPWCCAIAGITQSPAPRDTQARGHMHTPKPGARLPPHPQSQRALQPKIKECLALVVITIAVDVPRLHQRAVQVEVLGGEAAGCRMVCWSSQQGWSLECRGGCGFKSKTGD